MLGEPMKILTPAAPGRSGKRQEEVLTRSHIARIADFELADLQISPTGRRVVGPAGCFKIEPQVMLVFLRLLNDVGKVVTRAELLEECWARAVIA